MRRNIIYIPNVDSEDYIINNSCPRNDKVGITNWTYSIITSIIKQQRHKEYYKEKKKQLFQVKIL